ncbi:hypothetical protein DY000_02005967 [Brassica cretica]|uniref:DUF4005 domain-containing protein n=1 Tax=Brassica cretica TaxID=69181 RepID=A0ABQ7BZ48_BRACR|nr:hypothetical protein DY000_02005967 [Brassica cretica]
MTGQRASSGAYIQGNGSGSGGGRGHAGVVSYHDRSSGRTERMKNHGVQEWDDAGGGAPMAEAHVEFFNLTAAA